MHTLIECFFDGCVFPRNPGGRGGYGILVRRGFETLHAECGYIGQWPWLSNNCAEYAGVISVFRYLIRVSIEEALIYGDSALVIDQLNYHMKAKRGAYLPYYQEALALRAKLPRVSMEWIPREMNAGADELSKTGARKNVIGFMLDSSVVPIAPPHIPKRRRTRDTVGDIERLWQG